MVNVVALTGGSYQENLEFVQWLKAYYDQHVPQNAPKYDAVGRRNGKAFPTGGAAATATAPSTPVAVAAPAAPDVEPANVRAVAAPVASQPVSRRAATATATTATTTAPSEPAQKPLRTAPSSNAGAGVGATKAANSSSSEASRKLAELQVKLDRAEQERDFYFNKLRDVEIYCQTHPEANNQAVKDVTAILYAVEDEQ